MPKVLVLGLILTALERKMMAKIMVLALAKIARIAAL